VTARQITSRSEFAIPYVMSVQRPSRAQVRYREVSSMLQRLAVAAALICAVLIVALAPSTVEPAEAADSGPFIGLWSDGTATEAATMDDLGVSWGRVTLRWSDIEPTPGHFTWGGLDQAFASISGSGRRQVFTTIRNNPSWAAASRCTITTPTERANLAAFVDAVVRRYSGSIPDGPLAGRSVTVKYWQFYNEMDFTSPAIEAISDLGGCFGTATGSTATQTGRDNYARMLEAAGLAAHTADPDSKVVMGGVASSNYLSPTCPLAQCPFDQGFMQGVLTSLKNNGTLSRLDAVAVHYFSSQTGLWTSPGATDLVGRIVTTRKMMSDIGLTPAQIKPIFVDEGSFTEGVTNSTGDPNAPYNRNQEAYVSKVLARATFANVAGYFWFRRNDSLGPGLGGDWAFGLLTEQGAVKPSYGAYKYFASLVRSTSQSIGQLTFANPKLEGYEFSANDGRRFQVLWNQADAAIANPENIAYTPATGMGGAIADPRGTALARQGNAVVVGAEPRFIFAPNCATRPPVTLAVTPGGGPNRLQVTVTASTSTGVPNNRLSRVSFGAGTNSVVDIANGQSNVTSPLDLSLPDVPSTSFTIRRDNPAIGSAVVPLVVYDDCGPWPTFVGGGPAAWGTTTQAAAPAASTPPPPTPLACTPRPAVEVASVPDGTGRLRVTISASGSGNRLREIRVGGAANATLDVGGQTGIAGPRSVALPDGTEQTTLLVHRVTPNQPATVPLVVVDGCGAWPTLVGGGPNAF
jgi:hypothetical protein